MAANQNAQVDTSAIEANDGESAGPTADLTELPNDLFLLIISYLSPQEGVLCRRVSRGWHAAFTSDDVSRNLMRWHFPRAREMRLSQLAPKQPEWARIFPKVARRYFHLRSAKPRLIEKIDVVQEARQKGLFRAVEPWNRWLRWNDNTATFQYRNPSWCLDDGLLVYQENVSSHYVVYDLGTRHRFRVPFDKADKTVRRLRLACGILVIEWCEREPYHQLNDMETVHRHFATAFTVHRASSSGTSSEASVSPTIAFYSEWKIHFLGLPLNRHDRFFSAHTAKHYALYVWQPNRSPWGEEDPLEQLTIWNISTPSPYRPSTDPTGASKPEPGQGPTAISRFTWRDLEFLGLRQRHTPALREILLDDSNVYVHEEEHRWLSGQHSSLSPPRHHHVRCTGMPILGMGPRWFDECCADGDVHMSFCPRGRTILDGMSPERAPCWRHEEFPYLTVSDVVDAAARVRIVARQCFMMEALSAFVLPKISYEGRRQQQQQEDGEDEDEDEDDDGDGEPEEARFADDMWAQLLARGEIAGDERWVVGEDTEGRITVVRF
ncbi:Uu.00g014550.m01.CDS01 [Anthostomella pinea]|uniref:Uu.00g014550.m01.CDS01 n=1 Tax=Anthostomella pinea TaxID=933095 RepID=A0AAI8VYD1_9PEZI|nr:Uu.00g014550.m01.CDS01 [Anthostomella pinea]